MQLHKMAEHKLVPKAVSGTRCLTPPDGVYIGV